MTHEQIIAQIGPRPVFNAGIGGGYSWTNAQAVAELIRHDDTRKAQRVWDARYQELAA